MKAFQNRDVVGQDIVTNQLGCGEEVVDAGVNLERTEGPLFAGI